MLIIKEMMLEMYRNVDSGTCFGVMASKISEN